VNSDHVSIDLMRSHQREGWLSSATLMIVAIALSLASTSLRAGAETVGPVEDPPDVTSRTAIRVIIEKETATTGLPADIAEAVLFVESGYDPTVIGHVGEIGLMQVRPETAAMLGFRGSNDELAKPDVNIHYGVLYLSQAWRLAGGDLCRTLMKYRAGHGEETMTPRSQIYCNRARNRLLAVNSAWASPEAVAASGPVATARTAAKAMPNSHETSPVSVYAVYRRGTAAASRAFWAAHEARIREINARLEAKWKRVASR
jgi:Transglycosylase SLT domain